jgi:hypothetical protein
MSNEKQQTAVDLMYQRAISVLPMGSIDARRKLKETYDQAKEIEKEQKKHRAIESYYLYSQYLDQLPKVGGATVEMDFEQWYEFKFPKTP